ncbi:MAG TPA: hypothetical protein VM617_08930 [Thermoanaerobaculia bacterium]|nr:hypothetical protein [Thermoanaerobaculia bacterium]
MNHHTAPAPTRVILAAIAIVTLATCAAQTPEERVVALRADYEASLNSFQVLEEPLEPVAATTDGMAAEVDETTDGGAEATQPEAEEETAEEETMAAPVAVRQDVLLDIVVRNRSDGRLPGLTLDVEQVDAAEQPKAHYRIYLDTSTIGLGAERAVSHRLEDVDVTTDDKFHVEVRQAIPPEQRSDYREFSEVAEQP